MADQSILISGVLPASPMPFFLIFFFINLEPYFFSKGGAKHEHFNLNGKVVSLRLGDYFALCQNLEKAHLGRECRVAGNVAMAI